MSEVGAGGTDFSVRFKEHALPNRLNSELLRALEDGGSTCMQIKCDCYIWYREGGDCLVFVFNRNHVGAD